MLPAKKKPGLAAISVSFGKAHGDDDEDAPESSREGDSDDYEVARDELADFVGVKDEDREAFGEALRAFVLSCK